MPPLPRQGRHLPALSEKQTHLQSVLRLLAARDYRFTTPTPLTHTRVLKRAPERHARDLRDIFGWNLPFGEGALAAPIFSELQAADALSPVADGLWRCRYRVSSLEQDLFLHSAFPTDAVDAVFFGPDSYRFAQLLNQHLPREGHVGGRLVDIGTGSGVGAIAAARLRPDLVVHMTDINPLALELAAVNASVAGVAVTSHLSPDLDEIDGPIAFAIANPPFLIDPAERSYRNGGDMLGAGIALAMATEAVRRLTPGGRLVLYTASAIVAARDPFRATLQALAVQAECTCHYWEIDPDAYGEELENPAYRTAERIAIIGAVLTKV